jgi:hypothetical protein
MEHWETDSVGMGLFGTAGQVRGSDGTDRNFEAPVAAGIVVAWNQTLDAKSVLSVPGQMNWENWKAMEIC